MKPDDKPREKVQSDDHSREHRRGTQKSGGSNSRMSMALLYASAGLPVVPLHGVKDGLCTCGDKHCEQPGRHARTENAKTDPEEIKQMCRRWPKARIAIALSPKLVAVEVEGKAGRKELKKLESEQ